jgi:hypothetical protein
MVMPSAFDDMTYNGSKRGEGAQFKMNFKTSTTDLGTTIFKFKQRIYFSALTFCRAKTTGSLYSTDYYTGLRSRRPWVQIPAGPPTFYGNTNSSIERTNLSCQHAHPSSSTHPNIVLRVLSHAPRPNKDKSKA